MPVYLLHKVIPDMKSMCVGKIYLVWRQKMEMIVQNHFIRIRRNCIVNMKFIHSFFEREIRMTTGKRVEMSRRKITEVKEVFTKYLVLGGNHK